MNITALLLIGCGLATTANAFEKLSEPQVNKIANAVFRIEGGTKTRWPYGIKSVKTSKPREVCKTTIRNNYGRWQKAGSKGAFIEFLADRYCPPSVDKTGNTNWRKNIVALLKKS